jgi:hypothetical protein
VIVVVGGRKVVVVVMLVWGQGVLPKTLSVGVVYPLKSDRIYSEGSDYLTDPFLVIMSVWTRLHTKDQIK